MALILSYIVLYKMAPVMTINEDVYGRLTPDEVDKILDKYL